MEILIKRIDGSIEWVKIGEGVTLGLISSSYGQGSELLAVRSDTDISVIAAKAGSTKSDKKSAAARANGAKGGRPRKVKEE